MIYGFDTPERTQALAALLVYATWRSRDHGRYKITPEVWDQVTRFTRDAAKRSRDVPAFLNAFMPRFYCASIRPGVLGSADDGGRQFLVDLFTPGDHRPVVDCLYKTPEWIVALVRDRLERERALNGDDA